MTSGAITGPEDSSEPAESSARPRFRHPTGPVPRSIAIVACGPTSQQWHAGNFVYERQWGKPDEVWALNKGLRTIRCDLGFVMDDMVGEGRKSPSYADDLRQVTVPIITSIVDAEVAAMYPGLDLHALPVDPMMWSIGVRTLKARGWTDGAIVQEVQAARQERRWSAVENAAYPHRRYLHNSIPHILAYALFIGVREIGLFGADYTFPGQEAREDDRANAEYWVGVLRLAGVNVKVPNNTTLLSMNRPEFMYGYGARPPMFEMPAPEDIAAECEVIQTTWRR